MGSADGLVPIRSVIIRNGINILHSFRRFKTLWIALHGVNIDNETAPAIILVTQILIQRTIYSMTKVKIVILPSSSGE